MKNTKIPLKDNTNMIQNSTHKQSSTDI